MFIGLEAVDRLSVRICAAEEKNISPGLPKTRFASIILTQAFIINPMVSPLSTTEDGASVPVKIPRWATALDQAASRLQRRMVEIRRHLHQHPEPSGEETETTAYLAEIVNETGLPIRIGPEGRGLIVDSDLKTDVSRVAFRGDIDALWIQDAKEAEYRSRRAGVMHACGHDAHAAGVTGTIFLLHELAQAGLLPNDVHWRAILQPSEETASGAREMISIGALEEVSGIFALHLDPTRPAGAIGVRSGAFTASCDEFEIHIKGRGGHGARPHETIDPIAASAQMILGLYQMFPRRMDPHQPVVATVGQVSSGHSPNVIPETAAMKGTLRALDERTRARAKEVMADIVAGIAKTTGCEIHLTFPFGCPGVVNDVACTETIRLAARMIPDGLRVDEMSHASMGGEDFAEYLQHVRGAMFRLGCQPASGCSTLHSPEFDIDEKALGIGARLMARAVILRAESKSAE